MVSKATLTVVPNPVTRTYGASNPTLGYTLHGFVNTQTTAVVTGTASCSTTATKSSPVGTYAITCTIGSLAAADYNLSPVAGNLSVTRVALTVTPDPVAKTYGTPLPAIGYKITGFVNGNTTAVVSGTASCSTTATKSSPVGTYPTKCTVGSLSAADYTFGFAGGELTVTPATLTVTANDLSKAAGAPLPTLTYKVSGFTNGDTTSVVSGKASCSTTATASSPPGTYPITCTKGSLAASNYSFRFAPGELTVLAPRAAAPTITSLSRTGGPVSGGTKVTVTGTGFSTVTGVKFGTTAAGTFTVESTTQLVASAPAHAAGTVAVSVTTAAGTTPPTSADLYTYSYPLPVVTSISPASGPAAGGTKVTVSGSGFTGATTVYFGTSTGRTLSVNAAGTQLTVVSPAGTSGASVNVRVVTPGGESTAVTVDLFTYAPSPTITSLSRTSGPVSGGTKVTITGTGFSTVSKVRFGTTTAESFTVKSSTQIAATSPAHAAGRVTVSVTTPGGTTPSTSADQFTY